ncbi:hypothetical protein E1B28_009803 [Marasmius oreades]|uniref:Uncharacterized protein n=1 Tax=Marasmius oreades TaxID=181124 RepID=A0A9P7UT06_9AGAR|nr:uncharacterized protein E1B28_009803 [Marasmius oreades]KAG7090709.1 hypothetical protein E1B28_009803 [Marasmius oreades]
MMETWRCMGDVKMRMCRYLGGTNLSVSLTVIDRHHQRARTTCGAISAPLQNRCLDYDYQPTGLRRTREFSYSWGMVGWFFSGQKDNWFCVIQPWYQQCLEIQRQSPEHNKSQMILAVENSPASSGYRGE